MKRWIRAFAVAAALLMLLMSLPLSASATTGYADNVLNVATEPGGTSEFVTYYKNGVETPREEMTWVDGGVRGTKALELDGKDTYLQIGAEPLQTSTLTFSTWICFRGSADADNPAAMYNQRLFTIGDDTDCYFTVSPHAMSEGVANEDGMLNGVYMKYYRSSRLEGVGDQMVIAYDGAPKGVSHFGLPQNEWHHMAVVVESMAVKLYVDGNLILSEDLLMPVAQMAAEYMTIGKGLWGDPTLNALLDDVIMLDYALTQEQVVALMQTGATWLLADAAANTTTSTVYQPTAPTTTTGTTVPTEVTEDAPEVPFGLPMWGFGVCVGLVGMIVVLAVIVNWYELAFRRAHPEQAKPKASRDEEEEL